MIRIIIIICISLPFEISDALNLSKHCGENVCQKYQLCAEQELLCYPCNKVCERTSHNYNERSCEEHCQDYIHDFMIEYVKKCDLERVINRLYSLSIISLICILVLVVAVAALLYGRLQKHRRNNITSSFDKKCNKKYKQKLQSAVQYSINSNAAVNTNNINSRRRIEEDECDTVNVIGGSATTIQTISESMEPSMATTARMMFSADSSSLDCQNAVTRNGGYYYNTTDDGSCVLSNIVAAAINKKNKNDQSSAVDSTNENGINTSTTVATNLSSSQTATTNGTASAVIPLSSHPPCEDHSLDYAAYINQTLSAHSPDDK